MALDLQGWPANETTPDNFTLGADNISYALEAATVFETLRNTENSTIAIVDAVVCDAPEASLIRFDANRLCYRETATDFGVHCLQ